MNLADTLPWWVALPVALLLVLGGVVTLVGTLGLWRLPNFYQRIHGPAITITLGSGCVLLASMLYFSVGTSRWVVHEVLISLFVVLTAPVVSMLLMRTAVSRDPDWHPEPPPEVAPKNKVQSESIPMDTGGISS